MISQKETDVNAVIALYLDGPRLIEQALSGLSAEELDAAPDAENWTIRQIVHHLADGDAIWAMAVRTALMGGEPIFDLSWYFTLSQIQWSRNWAYASREIRPALDLLAASRRLIVELVQAVPEAWDCAVWVPWPNQEPGCISVGEILAMQGRHVCGHVEEIRRIRGNPHIRGRCFFAP